MPKVNYNGRVFSASISTANCGRFRDAELTITLKLFLNQVNPQNGTRTGIRVDGDNNRRSIVRWRPTQWKLWTNRLRRQATRYWDGKFWLIPKMTWFEFDHRGRSYVPNIHCRFVLQYTSSPIGADAVINVVRLATEETGYKSNAKNLDNTDNWLLSSYEEIKSGKHAGKLRLFHQRGGVHEVGHLIGLNHVDVGQPHCPTSGNTNDLDCYGLTDRDLRSLMGVGMGLRSQFADPWRFAAAALQRPLKTANPFAPPSSGQHAEFAEMLSTRSTIGIAEMNDWEVKMKRQSPRTFEEVLLGDPNHRQRSRC